MKNLPGIVIRKRFGSELSPIFILIELRSAVVNPASSNMAFSISAVLDLPFVPVTPMTRILREGNALSKFREIIKAQKGDDQVSSDKFRLKSKIFEIKSSDNGKIKEINNYNINSLAKILGAPIDKFAGIYLYKKIDEFVEKGEPLMSFYSSDKFKLKEAEISLKSFPVYDIE